MIASILLLVSFLFAYRCSESLLTFKFLISNHSSIVFVKSMVTWLFLLHTVPLDLNLMLVSIYSRAPTTFHRVVSRCLQASSKCSCAWFYIRMTPTSIYSRVLSSSQWMLESKRYMFSCMILHACECIILPCITRWAFNRCLQATLNSWAKSICEHEHHVMSILKMIASPPLQDSIW